MLVEGKFEDPNLFAVVKSLHDPSEIVDKC